jgi:hypothetical protein
VPGLSPRASCSPPGKPDRQKTRACHFPISGAGRDARSSVCVLRASNSHHFHEPKSLRDRRLQMTGVCARRRIARLKPPPFASAQPLLIQEGSPGKSSPPNLGGAGAEATGVVTGHRGDYRPIGVVTGQPGWLQGRCIWESRLEGLGFRGEGSGINPPLRQNGRDKPAITPERSGINPHYTRTVRDKPALHQNGPG